MTSQYETICVTLNLQFIIFHRCFKLILGRVHPRCFQKMAIWNLLVCFFVFATAFVQSKEDPWMQDPMLMGLWKLTRAINSFGLKLFNDVTSSTRGNVLICPYSLSNPLGILHFGSAGETEKELAYVLGYQEFNLTKDEVAQTYYMLSTKQLKSSNPKFYLFEAPSTIIVNRKNGLLPTFQRMVEVLFQAPITVSDFILKGDEVIQSVNDWVAARTRNKIQKIMQTVDPYSDMIVVNAAYFKGTWIHKFPTEQTKLRDFYNYGLISNSRNIHMMRMANVLNFHIDRHHSILELPFKGRNVSMIILLPHKLDGIKDLMSKFSPEFLEEQILEMRPCEMDVVIPKFKLSFEEELTNKLKQMGAKTLFQPGKVNFSEMIRRQSVTIGDVLHKAVISVTENGVEAAAVTAIFSFRSIMPDPVPDFLADHPFLFVLYERRIKMVLFVGSVMAL